MFLFSLSHEGRGDLLRAVVHSVFSLSLDGRGAG